MLPRRRDDDWNVEWGARHVPFIQLALIITGSAHMNFVQSGDIARDLYRLRLIGYITRNQHISKSIKALRLSSDRNQSNPENIRLSRTHGKANYNSIRV